MATEFEFRAQLAAICHAAANLVLNPPAQPSEPDADPEPAWAAERRLWAKERGTDVPMDWTAEATSMYLIEVAHQVRAIGDLLVTGSVTASLDPLVRAAVERAGRIRWLLDPTIDTEERGARAGLEMGVSMQAYRKALDQLGAHKDICTDWKARVGDHRKLLDELFAGIEKKPLDPFDPGSKPSKEFTDWTVVGETYPTYAAAAGYALQTESTTAGQGKATYAGLAGFSHPSVVFAREHYSINNDNGVIYTYQQRDLENSVRQAAFGLLNAFRNWAGYYAAAPELVQQRIDEISDQIGTISVIV